MREFLGSLVPLVPLVRSNFSTSSWPPCSTKAAQRISMWQCRPQSRYKRQYGWSVILYVIIICVTYYHETPAVVHQRRETPVHPLHACLDEARPLRHGEFTTDTHSVFSLKRQHDIDITISNYIYKARDIENRVWHRWYSTPARLNGLPIAPRFGSYF